MSVPLPPETLLKITSEYLRDALEEISVAFGLPIAHDDGHPICNGVLLYNLIDRGHELTRPAEGGS